MPGRLNVRIVSARNLPIMDRSTELTDAFVEIKIGNNVQKTEVCRKSLNPQWNSGWFKFEVDDEHLQNEPLQIRVLDHDTYTSHDAIGKIYIDLNPLLNENKSSSISGWYPIYDTMHGIQGQLYVIIKINLFSDVNRFRKSSCGVKFFCTPGVPEGFYINGMQGFVEELIVNDDPEYQWIDKIRSMRASNEARQMRFSKLSGQLQRKIGLKVLEMGGNAVLGYRQCFDLEGESGVVVRAIGTCVTLKVVKVVSHAAPSPGTSTTNPLYPESSQTSDLVHHYHHQQQQQQQQQQHQSASTAPPTDQSTAPVNLTSTNTNAAQPSTAICSNLSTNQHAPSIKLVTNSRRVSESDVPEHLLTPNKTSITGPPLTNRKTPFNKLSINRGNIEMMEFPFFTMTLFGIGSIKHLGGVVSTTSVKLLDKINDPEEPMVRDSWWSEIRTEIRSHMKSLHCNSVLGYIERTHIHEELIILSASGTAAILNQQDFLLATTAAMTTTTANEDGSNLAVTSVGVPNYTSVPESVFTGPVDGNVNEKNTLALEIGDTVTSTSSRLNRLQVNWPPERSRLLSVSDNGGNDDDDDARRPNDRRLDGALNKSEDTKSSTSLDSVFPQCSICHIPYNEKSLPFPVNLCKCLICLQCKVPDILFCTIEPPIEFPIIGKPCMLQARICRSKKESRGEINAKEVSDSLPFVEYDLHKQLVNKLKVKGMNSLFGLRIQIAVGETQLIAVATATGMYCEALPPPGIPMIINKSDSTLSEAELQMIRNKLNETIKKNKEAYKINDHVSLRPPCHILADIDESSSLDIKWPNETFVFQIDDLEDKQVVSVLMEPAFPAGYEVVNTQRLANMEEHVVCNIQMFTKVWRGTLNNPNNSSLDAVFDNIMKSLFFKFRGMRPCSLAHLQFDVDICGEDEVQVLITGVCCGLAGGVNDQVIDESGRTSCSTLVSRMSAQKHVLSLDKSDHPLDNDTLSPLIESPSTPINIKLYSGHIGDVRSNTTASIMSSLSIAETKRLKHHSGKTKPFGVQLTPLSWLPRAKIENYLGHLNFFIIRESTAVREEGGTSWFVHSFLAEVMSICRSHVKALGGNGLVSMEMVECVLENNLHKNQSQCLINVFGDVVNMAYDPDSVSTSHISLDKKNVNHSEC